MLPEISVSLYVRTDFLKFQEMIFKFPRKFVRLDLKSTFPVLENSGSVREGFKNLLLNSPVKGVPPAPLTELILLPKKFAFTDRCQKKVFRTLLKGRLESLILMNFQKISKGGGGVIYHSKILLRFLR